MKHVLNGHFYNLSCGNLSFDGVIEELIRYMAEKPEKFYEIIVGCDSPSGIEPHFPVAVVILRTGEGGRFFLKKINYSASSKKKKFYNWYQRVMEEVLLSCQLASCLREEMEKKIRAQSNSFDWQFRYVHADVGNHGQTKDMVREVVGLIRGTGFEPKIKPEAYVASIVADRYT
ncbi:ribonuclease H-like YkuK family protein [Thermodesulfovibrionales bacterium]|nr:ribonuclease H-like YkuK family protein [Thermodesulfovibrionales bacterium]MCL0049916.1 ribonuclease H-like YkuK family protein [Thermodesulfovibrionales bacterium]